MTKETLDFDQALRAGATPVVPGDKTSPTGSNQNESLLNVPELPVEMNDDEEALEQYMNSMLERLTGSNQAAPATTEPDPLEPVDAIVEETPVAAEALREPVRPSQLREDLSRMRELANRNVESALGVHAYSRLVKSAKSTSAAALGISLTSTLLVLFSHITGVSWAYPAAIAGTALATLASLRYFGISRRLAKIGRQLRWGTE